MTSLRPKDTFNGVVKRAALETHNAIVLEDEQGKQLALKVASLKGFESRSLSYLIGRTVEITGRADSKTLFVDKTEDITVKPRTTAPRS